MFKDPFNKLYNIIMLDNENALDTLKSMERNIQLLMLNYKLSDGKAFPKKPTNNENDLIDLLTRADKILKNANKDIHHKNKSSKKKTVTINNLLYQYIVNGKDLSDELEEGSHLKKVWNKYYKVLTKSIGNDLTFTDVLYSISNKTKNLLNKKSRQLRDDKLNNIVRKPNKNEILIFEGEETQPIINLLKYCSSHSFILDKTISLDDKENVISIGEDIKTAKKYQQGTNALINSLFEFNPTSGRGIGKGEFELTMLFNNVAFSSKGGCDVWTDLQHYYEVKNIANNSRCTIHCLYYLGEKLNKDSNIDKRNGKEKKNKSKGGQERIYTGVIETPSYGKENLYYIIFKDATHFMVKKSKDVLRYLVNHSPGLEQAIAIAKSKNIDVSNIKPDYILKDSEQSNGGLMVGEDQYNDLKGYFADLHENLLAQVELLIKAATTTQDEGDQSV